jgi:SWI/SNF-related matrix-associated actin-dependent regulator of chromatin subfamily A-like protein 1
MSGSVVRLWKPSLRNGRNPLAKIIHHCPTCHKPATLSTEVKVLNLYVRTYMCGHSETFAGTLPSEKDTLDIVSMDGKHLFPFQLEGARFAERSNIRCLIADEMGLGKTVQATSIVVAHPEVRPFFAFVKSGLRMQWFKEMIRWGDIMCQIIDGASSTFLPKMEGYLISQDTAWRIGYRMRNKKEMAEAKAQGDLAKYVRVGPDIKEIAEKLGIKLCIIDECQQIKSGDSKRTNAIRKACSTTPHVIALSGTPIMNNAAEYFPILNILRPDKFPNENQYVYGWCDTYFDGYKTKIGGLKNPKAFLDYTKDFIIRRERSVVLPDLPKIFRKNTFCDLGEMVEEEYRKTQVEFNEYYDGNADMDNALLRASNILAYLSKMRHLTGLCKIDPICEFMEGFITQTDRKMCIFVHHKDVSALLSAKLSNMAKGWPREWGESILTLVSEMDSYQRDECVMKFGGDKHRIMVASTLASGEGLNMQFCSDMIMAERQWNPAKEEQAEARFPRPGSTADKINANYFIAVGTVDEFFSEIVERKREIVSSTMAGEAARWDESSLIQDLARAVRERGGQKWGF